MLRLHSEKLSGGGVTKCLGASLQQAPETNLLTHALTILLPVIHLSLRCSSLFYTVFNTHWGQETNETMTEDKKNSALFKRMKLGSLDKLFIV